MNSLNLVLEVSCKCGKGNVVLDNTYFDTSIMTCTVCDNSQNVNCYYVDELLDLHTYNSSLSEDVKVLNANGDWVKNHEKQFVRQNVLDNMLEGYILICEAECYERIDYYKKGLDFLMVRYDSSDKEYVVYKFVAKEENITNLFNYFM